MGRDEIIEFGKNLKRRHEALGLTQSELGAKLGVEANTISRWELGNSEPEHPQMLEKALLWMEMSKAVSEDPFFDGIEGRIAQIEAIVEAGRKRLRAELPALIARREGDPDFAEDVAELKADLAKLEAESSQKRLV